MTSRGQSPPPPTTPAPPGVARLGKAFRKWRSTLPYGVKVGARGEAPRFRREAWGQQGQAGRESAWQRVGFADPGALRIPLVSKFPLGSASARSRPGPSSAARDTGGSERGAGRRGEGRKAGPAPAPALPAGRARPLPPRGPWAGPPARRAPRRPALQAPPGPRLAGPGRRPGTEKPFSEKVSVNCPTLSPDGRFVNRASHLTDQGKGSGPRRTRAVRSSPLISGTLGNWRPGRPVRGEVTLRGGGS